MFYVFHVSAKFYIIYVYVFYCFFKRPKSTFTPLWHRSDTVTALLNTVTALLHRLHRFYLNQLNVPRVAAGPE